MEDRINFFTMTGYDVWAVVAVKTMVDLRNATTGEKVTIEKGDGRFKPAEIRIAEHKIRANKKAEVKKKSPVQNKPDAESSPHRKKTSEYKGVSKNKDGKFSAAYWDGANKKPVHLGVFRDELLAAAAFQDHIGNKKEAEKLRADYQEGDGLPEPQSRTISVTAGGSHGPKKRPAKRRYPVGVYPAKNAAGVTRYHAQISAGKKNRAVHLGTHDTPEMAAAAIEKYRSGAKVKAANIKVTGGPQFGDLDKY